MPPSRRRVLSLAGAAAGTGACLSLPIGPRAPKPRGDNASRGRPSPEVAALVASMTLDEKVGQMAQADLRALKPEADVRTYGLGSVLNGGDSWPTPNEPEGWADTYDRLQGQALETRLGIPILYGVDAVHGHALLRGATVFPHNIGLGCTRNAALVERIGRITATEVAATGLDWAFAPCLAVPRDERWGRTYEGYGESAELVASLGAAAIRGLQAGGDLGRPDAVLACAKHFVGDGGTALGKDQGDTLVDEATLRAVHLPGYVAAIEANVASVMVSYSKWNGAYLHGHRPLITDVLKGELGFKGFVVTDWEAIDRMPGDYARDVETAINAGIDMVMVPRRYPEFVRVLKALAQSGRVSQARIDDAVTRILTAKRALRVWERPFAERSLASRIGCAEHRTVARQAVRESLVLLKNEGGVLPLRRGRHVHVAGARANDLGIQCGGWTVSWQGRKGRVTEGTTILEALAAAAGGAGRVTFDVDGAGAAAADVAVVVVGENPYAEMKGDRQNLTLSREDLALVDRVAATGKPMVLVLISGRPLVLGPALDAARAVVAVWLPGSEGGGVADVLYGDARPVGKLSHSWPRAMAQVPVNVGDAVYDPLFPFGFGLTYGA